MDQDQQVIIDFNNPPTSPRLDPAKPQPYSAKLQPADAIRFWVPIFSCYDCVEA
jgi:hypothetical protein